MTDTHPRWYLDECRHVGTDFADPIEVEKFEERRRQFWDIDAENRELLDLLDLQPDQTVLDMGAGTGLFAIEAARHCRHVHYVDISPAMTDFARAKAAEAGLANITFHAGGFLSYEHTAEPVDVVVSKAVLHHLPDMWKAVALQRVAAMINPGGRLCLMDVVFTFRPRDFRPAVERMVAWFEGQTDAEFARHLEGHVRNEYSTFDWVMEGLLRRAGFRIDRTDYTQALAAYLCTREGAG